MKLKNKIHEQTEEQKFMARKHGAVDALATEAGFDEEAFVYTEFYLMPLFEIIVEKCAKIAEQQSVNYTGEYKEGTGCYDAANAIRTFGKLIGNSELY